MADPSSSSDKIDPEAVKRQIQSQHRRVMGLRAQLYSQADPSTGEALRQRLADEEVTLRRLEYEVKDLPSPPSPEGQAPASAPRGRMLGPKTTGLRVEPKLHMNALPTGVYNLLNPETHPLLSVAIWNESRDPKRICVRAYIEGLSATEVHTVEIDQRKHADFNLLPTLIPEQAHRITEVQRAMLHVKAEDLDGKTEMHETYSIVCLARTSSFNTVQRPDTGEVVDLSHYYGAWVTPHQEEVQKVIRRAADLVSDRQIWGYQRDPDSVTQQVGALYQSLKEGGITYINSVIDYGAPPGQATQRTRLPRESLSGRAANCIDGSVLFASLLEGSSLNAALVLVPGHAFVGWEVWDGSDEWKFLETTMISSHDFEAACLSGERQYEQAKLFGSARLVMHRLGDLRARGIWPMK
jgi:hypothetical protein